MLYVVTIQGVRFTQLTPVLLSVTKRTSSSRSQTYNAFSQYSQNHIYSGGLVLLRGKHDKLSQMADINNIFWPND